MLFGACHLILGRVRQPLWEQVQEKYWSNKLTFGALISQEKQISPPSCINTVALQHFTLKCATVIEYLKLLLGPYSILNMKSKPLKIENVSHMPQFWPGPKHKRRCRYRNWSHQILHSGFFPLNKKSFCRQKSLAELGGIPPPLYCLRKIAENFRQKWLKRGWD